MNNQVKDMELGYREDVSSKERRRLAAAMIVYCSLREKRKQKRSCWKRSWVEKKIQFSQYHNILPELQDRDRHSYRRYLRMTEDQFHEILGKVSPRIQRKNTQFREAIPAGEKLAITLRFLATGDAYRDLQFAFSVPHNSISKFVPEVCEALYDCLKDDHLKFPSSSSEWDAIADDFQTKWNFPKCIGALDGKHVLLRCPLESGSFFYNYKGTYSMVLLALVDANYRFTYIDVGKNGRVSDGGVFRDSSLYATMEGMCSHSATESEFPHVIVGDEAFPLKPYLMKPYAARILNQERRIFNYRLSRARRVSENAFGILAARFRVFHTRMAVKADTAEKVVLAACSLHNYLRNESLSVEKEERYIDDCDVDQENVSTLQVTQGKWRQYSDAGVAGFVNLSCTNSNHSCAIARSVREKFCKYFNNEGQVAWQWQLNE